jgi:hypothetical protein
VNIEIRRPIVDPGTAAAVARWRAHLWIPQLCVGSFLLLFGLWIGRDNVMLMRAGVRTEGRIVGFRTEVIRDNNSNFNTDAQMPIVEYHIGDHPVRFQDWLAGRHAEQKNAIVPVLYDPHRPTVAMIDRPFWNWIPWGVMAAMGVLVLSSSLGGFVRFLGARGTG